MALSQGSPGNPVQQDPFQLIVAVDFPRQGQFFYAKHIKIKTGTGVSISSPYDGQAYPPRAAFDGGVHGPDPGFAIEQTGSRIISNSETISLDDDTADARHFVIWAQFYAPDPHNPLPTDDQFRGYYAAQFYGASFDSVQANYDLHGDLLATTGHPR